MSPENKPTVAPPAPTQTTTTTTTTKPMQGKSNKTLFIVLGVILLLCLCLGVVGGVIYYLTTRAAADLANTAATSLQQSTGSNGTSGTNGSNGTNGTNGSNGSTGTSPSTSIGINGGASLPSGFPTDVPIFAGANITGSTTSDGEMDVLMTAQSSPGSVYSFYKTNLAANGWTITSDTNLGTAYGIEATKNGKTVNVGIADYSTDQSNTTSFVSVTYK